MNEIARYKTWSPSYLSRNRYEDYLKSFGISFTINSEGFYILEIKDDEHKNIAKGPGLLFFVPEDYDGIPYGRFF